jgi:Tol biopolymer transport system component
MNKIFLFSIFIFWLTNSNAQDATTIQLWKDSAIGTIYNPATASVAFGKPNKKGIYQLFLADSSGLNMRQLTYSLWDKECHQWPEEWTPDGQYLFCYVEKSEHVQERHHRRKKVDATPGYGAYTDLWLIKQDGSKAWKLLDLPNSFDSGIIHSAISDDGSLFAWSERIKAPVFGNLNLLAGAYVIRVAKFQMDSIPHFSAIRTFQPGNRDACNELESISPNNESLLFYSTFETKNIFNTPIYSLNLSTQAIVKLTSESFAQAPTFTPNGKQIIYMTGYECDIFPLEIQGSDWWIMDSDGSNKKRLTYMNQKGNPQCVNHYRLAGSLSFINDHEFYGGIMTKPLGLIGYTVRVHF